MNQQRNENSGSLWHNENKKSEKSPDFLGSVTINGIRYSLSGWNKIVQKEGQNKGKNFLSLLASEYQENGGNNQQSFNQPQQFAPQQQPQQFAPQQQSFGQPQFGQSGGGAGAPF